MCQTFKTRAPRVGESALFEASGVAMTASINLAHKLATFSDHFAPRTVATFNGLDIMVVKIKGAFQWHSHSDSDDFFLVLQGRMRVETEHGHADIGPGDYIEIGMLGAYGSAMKTAFNGFGAAVPVNVADEPMSSLYRGDRVDPRQSDNVVSLR